MNPFKFPTDNMYKFLAILFAALYLAMIASALFAVVKLTPLYLDAADTFHALDRASIITNKKIELEKANHTFSGMKEIELTDELSKSEDEMQNVQDRLAFFKKLINYGLIILAVFGSLTSFGIVFSFRAWYTKLQCYEDLIVKNQSASFNPMQNPGIKKDASLDEPSKMI